MKYINKWLMRKNSWNKIFLVMMLFIAQSGLTAQLDVNVVDSNGNPLQNAVVALVPMHKKDYTTAPTAIMDQRNNMFMPGVLVIRVNTLVHFPNSDDVRHHVYSFSPAKKFELRLYHGMTAEPILFDKPGTVILGCNIHDSMVAHIYVVETDHFAVADALGKIRLDAPADKYQLHIYHPRMNGNFPESTVVLDDAQSTAYKAIINNLSPTTITESTDEFSSLF